MGFDREAYLDRIGLDRAPPATEAGLVRLHRAQAFAIPFETFDIHLGRGISLDPDVLVDKLVRRRRGGYCFELNSLFAMALDDLGFERRPLLGRVHLRGEPTGRFHLNNLVRLNGRDWLADPGFGAVQLREPIPLERDRVATQEGFSYRLVDGGDYGTLAQHLEDGAWKDWFSFTLEPVWPIDIEAGNHFTSTHPDFVFVRHRVAIRAIPFGKITLMDFALRRHGPDGVEDSVLDPGPAYLAAVEAHFGIVLDAPYEALKPVEGEGGVG